MAKDRELSESIAKLQAKLDRVIEKSENLERHGGDSSPVFKQFISDINDWINERFRNKAGDPSAEWINRLDTFIQVNEHLFNQEQLARVRNQICSDCMRHRSDADLSSDWLVKMNSFQTSLLRDAAQVMTSELASQWADNATVLIRRMGEMRAAPSEVKQALCDLNVLSEEVTGVEIYTLFSDQKAEKVWSQQVEALKSAISHTRDELKKPVSVEHQEEKGKPDPTVRRGVSR